MKHTEGRFRSFDNLYLYYQTWQPDQPIQAIVAMVHGLGGHSSLFYPAVQHLVTQGYAIYAFDLRGHGRSPGQRGHINSWAEFRQDLHLFLQQIQQQQAAYPCFLWGHSLGGTIALDYALRSPEFLRGLIVTAPALEKVQIPPFKLAIGCVLSQVAPRFSLRLGLRNDVCLRNPNLCAAYLQDPLRHDYGSARLATEFFATVSWIYQHISELKMPLLLLHCQEDEVTLAKASRDFFQQVMVADKEHHEYLGCYHDLHLEANYQILVDLNLWLERHIQGSTDEHSLTPCPS